MHFQEKLIEVQKSLIQHRLDGWLLYDFRRTNPLCCNFLDIPSDKLVTRRFFYWIPKHGVPVKILSILEPRTLDHLPGVEWFYRTWHELESFLFSILAVDSHVAMEYSPYNSLPVISKVDAGTIELVKKTGAQIVSSANILQKYTSVLSQEQAESHFYAAEALIEIAHNTWDFIKKSIRSKKAISEFDVQQHMLKQIQERECVTEHPPICAVNEHSADPHYEPALKHSKTIHADDFILIDLWCKQKAPQSIYADIAQVGIAASKPLDLQQKVFDIVKSARNRATDYIRKHYEKGELVQGWQVDQLCRDYINEKGYGDFFIHRTGHNIGQEVHGAGANLDNLETHDFRSLLPGTCFSVEPGIYLPDQFGVRLEYDIYLEPNHKIKITGGIQEEIICLL